MIRQLILDAVEMTRAATGEVTAKNVLRTAIVSDSFAVMALTRVREVAIRYHVPGLNRALRFVQQGLYGIEIGKSVSLGDGIYLVHTMGTVIGGTSRIGRRVKFMGNNTVGTAKDNGCPVIEEDVVVGCGARILGPVRVGARARIGANAVVLSDVAADSVVGGIPARPLERTAAATTTDDSNGAEAHSHS